MPGYASVCSHYGKRSCRQLLLAHVYNRLTAMVTAAAARQVREEIMLLIELQSSYPIGLHL